MHVLEHQQNLCQIEPDNILWELSEQPQHIHEFSMLKVVHQDVDVPFVLSHSPHSTDELVVELSHVLNLVEQVLLLLGLQDLALSNYLESVNVLEGIF